jgi:hypothetical protein
VLINKEITIRKTSETIATRDIKKSIKEIASERIPSCPLTDTSEEIASESDNDIFREKSSLNGIRARTSITITPYAEVTLLVNCSPAETVLNASPMPPPTMGIDLSAAYLNERTATESALDEIDV